MTTDTAYEAIVTRVEDGVGWVTFNRPERMNALDSALFGEAIDCLEGWRRDPDVAVVVLTGGDQAFAAGLDLEELVGHTADQQDLYNETTYNFYKTILEYPKPTIASIAGPAIGGGADIAVFCDIRVGGESAVIGFPQAKFGFTTFFDPLWKIVGLSQAKLMIFSGENVDAKRAVEIGLIDRLVPDAELTAATQKLAAKIARNGNAILRLDKEQALRTPPMDSMAGFVYAHALYRDVSRDEAVQAKVRAIAEKMRGS